MINMLGLKVEIIKIVMPIIYIIGGSILFKIIKNVIIKATSKRKVLKQEQEQKIRTKKMENMTKKSKQ